MEAILSNKIPVEHSVRPDVNREFLTLQCPNGWDDVNKLRTKVLVFDNKEYKFSGWNSDTNQCFFFKPLNADVQTAFIIQ